MAFRPGAILVAYTEGLHSAPYSRGAPHFRAVSRAFSRLLAALPAGGGGHRSRAVRIAPDGRIDLSFGISGNRSREYLGEEYLFPNRRGGVLVLDEAAPSPRGVPLPPVCATRSASTGIRARASSTPATTVRTIGL